MSERPPQRRGGRTWLVLVLGAVALVAVLAWLFPDGLSSERDWMHVVYLVGLLALVSAGIVGRRRLGGLRKGVRDAAIWIAVGLALVAGYGFRHEIAVIGDRVLGELMPSRGVVTGEGTVVFRAGKGGHFRIEAAVEGTPVRFIVDTGASEVVLTRADARRVGFDPAALDYRRVYATANGPVRVAPVRLHAIEIGPIRVTDVAAAVTRSEMPSSLLGMSFLDRLASYEVSGGSLTLRQ